MTGQQGWPVPPQVEHCPGIPLAAVRPVHANPVLQVPLLPTPQHGCPDAPQTAQALSPSPEVQAPWVQVFPAQQTWASPPHMAHVPVPPAVIPLQARPV